MKDRINIRVLPEQYEWLLSRGVPSKVVRQIIDDAMSDKVVELSDKVVELSDKVVELSDKPKVSKPKVSKEWMLSDKQLSDKKDQVDQPVVSKQTIDTVIARGDWGRQRSSGVTKLSFDEWLVTNRWKYEK